MKKLFVGLGAALVWSATAGAEPARSLTQARSEIIDGTATGIVLIPASPPKVPTPTPAAAPAAPAVAAVAPAARPPAAAMAAASAPSASSATWAVTAVAAPANRPPAAAASATALGVPAAPAVAPAAAAPGVLQSAIANIGALLSGQPLTGDKLSAAKRPDSGKPGIALPTAADKAASGAGTR